MEWGPCQIQWPNSIGNPGFFQCYATENLCVSCHEYGSIGLHHRMSRWGQTDSLQNKPGSRVSEEDPGNQLQDLGGANDGFRPEKAFVCW